MKKKRDKKGCTVHVRLPCWLKKELQTEAEHYKQSLSAWIVGILLDRS